MTVAELITRLQAMPQEAIVKVYEFDGDFWDDVAEVIPSKDEVQLLGQYGKDIA